jgi:hypothetical protein
MFLGVKMATQFNYEIPHDTQNQVVEKQKVWFFVEEVVLQMH